MLTEAKGERERENRMQASRLPFFGLKIFVLFWFFSCFCFCCFIYYFCFSQFSSQIVCGFVWLCAASLFSFFACLIVIIYAAGIDKLYNIEPRSRITKGKRHWKRDHNMLNVIKSFNGISKFYYRHIWTLLCELPTNNERAMDRYFAGTGRSKHPFNIFYAPGNGIEKWIEDLSYRGSIHIHIHWYFYK